MRSLELMGVDKTAEFTDTLSIVISSRLIPHSILDIYYYILICIHVRKLFNKSINFHDITEWRMMHR